MLVILGPFFPLIVLRVPTKLALRVKKNLNFCLPAINWKSDVYI